MSLTLPGAEERFRCGRCGNLTRFDVDRRTRVREYWHVALSGEPAVDHADVVEDVVLGVTCRWCGATDEISVVPRPDDA